MHALVVEDDRNSLSALVEIVERDGFTATGAASLREARAALGRVSPSLVLTRMPSSPTT